jgi:2,3-bisphosphoglycerate-independent phosphoglycerate mutase
VEMCDEYILPYAIGDYAGVADGDSMLHTNYRQDRAIQLTRAFVDPAYAGHLTVRRRIVYAGLTRYYDDFTEYIMGAMDEEGGMENLLGEVIAGRGLRQLRIAETQKFRHVTSFFNGKSTKPFAGEDQVEVPSRFDAALFASHPEMEAYNVTDEIFKRLENNPYAFIAVNYANGDMVGHTGNFEAVVTAMQALDLQLARLVPVILAAKGTPSKWWTSAWASWSAACWRWTPTA